MYPQFPWTMVAYPLGSAGHTLEPTGIDNKYGTRLHQIRHNSSDMKCNGRRRRLIFCWRFHKIIHITIIIISIKDLLLPIALRPF